MSGCKAILANGSLESGGKLTASGQVGNSLPWPWWAKKWRGSGMEPGGLRVSPGRDAGTRAVTSLPPPSPQGGNSALSLAQRAARGDIAALLQAHAKQSPSLSA